MKEQLSRRKLLLSGAGASVAAALMQRDSYAVSATGNTPDLQLIPPSDSRYAELLSQNFPGLQSNPKFTPVAPLTVLLQYNSGPRLAAFSLVWSVNSASGAYETPMFHYSHAGSRRKKKIGAASVSGTRPILRAGHLVLLSPFFAWTPSRYQAGSHNWGRVNKKAEPGAFMLSEIQNSATVSVTIDAAITKKKLVAGSDKYNLCRRFSIRRNGEHDESLAIYRMLQSSASNQDIQNALNSHATAPRSSKSENVLWYKQARRSQAEFLLAIFSSFGRDRLLTLVTRAVNQPKTVVQQSA